MFIAWWGDFDGLIAPSDNTAYLRLLFVFEVIHVCVVLKNSIHPTLSLPFFIHPRLITSLSCTLFKTIYFGTAELLLIKFRLVPAPSCLSNLIICYYFFQRLQKSSPTLKMAPRKGKVQKEEAVVTLGPQVREGETVFGVAHIFASFNDTFVHVTDMSGR